jgi:spore maturation protein CgeB
MIVSRSYSKLKYYWNKGLCKLSSVFQKSFQYESRLDESIESVYRPRLIGFKRAELGEQLLKSSSTLRILYVAMKYDYGCPRRGLSYEENNFFHSLLNMGLQIIRFDFKAIEKKFGRAGMNKMLLETVYRYNPELMFVVLFRNELDKEIIKEISTNTETITINWFCDDHWRFDNYSRYWAPTFNWVTTTAKSALPKYKNKIKKAGIAVKVWGYGWPSGKVSQSEMIKIFNCSKINLNLSNASRPGVEQIKGRDFEIPGCGGFLNTGYSENINEYFNVDKEIICYRDVDDLIDKIRYYLDHDDEREEIAKAGYFRVLDEHTYEKRFLDIFKSTGVI